jgi:uncharacterized protein
MNTTAPPTCPVCGASCNGHAPPTISSESRGWSVGAHLGGLGAGLLSGGVLGFLGPLLVWIARRDDDAFTEHHAKEALNFQLTVLLAIMASILLAIPVVIIGVLTLGIGLLLAAGAVLAAVVAWFVLPIVGAARASGGEGYRYPFTLRLVR